MPAIPLSIVLSLAALVASQAVPKPPAAPVVRSIPRGATIAFAPTDTIIAVWDYTLVEDPKVDEFRVQVGNSSISLGKPSPSPVDATTVSYQAPIGSYPSGSYNAVLSACNAGGCTPALPMPFTVSTPDNPPPPPPPPDPSTSVESPNGTLLPPATVITSASGHDWTLSGTTILRDGQPAGNGKGSKLYYASKSVFAFGTDGRWYVADETNPEVYWAQLPGGPPPLPPECPADPLRVTVTKWPSSATKSASGTWNPNGSPLVSAQFSWNPQRFLAVDTRGCAATIVR